MTAAKLEWIHVEMWKMFSEVAEMTPEKERGLDEDAVDGRAEQHRRISQQGKATILLFQFWIRMKLKLKRSSAIEKKIIRQTISV